MSICARWGLPLKSTYIELKFRGYVHHGGPGGLVAIAGLLRLAEGQVVHIGANGGRVHGEDTRAHHAHATDALLMSCVYIDADRPYGTSLPIGIASCSELHRMTETVRPKISSHAMRIDGSP